MANTVFIRKEKGVLHLLVDGKEIKDVMSYQLSERVGECPTLSVTVAVLEDITVEIEGRPSK